MNCDPYEETVYCDNWHEIKSESERWTRENQEWVLNNSNTNVNHETGKKCRKTSRKILTGCYDIENNSEFIIVLNSSSSVSIKAWK